MNKIQIPVTALLALAMPCLVQAKDAKIAVIIELTGPSAAIAQDCPRGFEVALQAHTNSGKIGSVGVKLIYGDTKGDPGTAITELRRLAEDPDLLAAFTFFSKTAMPMNPISKELKLPLLATSGHLDFVRLNPYAFRFWPAVGLEAQALARQAVKSGLKRMALLTLQEEWPVSLSKEFTRVFENLGGSVVYEESISGAENDFASFVTSLRAKKPDAILVNLSIGQIGAALRRIRELGLRQPIYSNYRLQYKENIEVAGTAALEGALYFETDVQQPKFLALLKQQSPPCGSPAVCFMCYSAMRTFLNAIEKNQTMLSRETIFKTMSQSQSVDLIDGELRFNGREAEYKLAPRVFRAGIPVAQP